MTSTNNHKFPAPTAESVREQCDARLDTDIEQYISSPNTLSHNPEELSEHISAQSAEARCTTDATGPENSIGKASGVLCMAEQVIVADIATDVNITDTNPNITQELLGDNTTREKTTGPVTPASLLTCSQPISSSLDVSFSEASSSAVNSTSPSEVLVSCQSFKSVASISPDSLRQIPENAGDAGQGETQSMPCAKTASSETYFTMNPASNVLHGQSTQGTPVVPLSFIGSDINLCESPEIEAGRRSSETSSWVSASISDSDEMSNVNSECPVENDVEHNNDMESSSLANNSHQLVFTRIELMSLARNDFSCVNASLVGKFSLLPSPDGQGLFDHLEGNRKLLPFLKSIRATYRLSHESLADGEWEDEYEDEQSGFAAPQQLWESLSQQNKQLISKIMATTALALLQEHGQVLDSQEPKEKKEAARAPGSAGKAGLFTSEFDWTKLTPALQTVYDKQGHRQEIIDGKTFWKFLCKCTTEPLPGMCQRNNVVQPPTRESAPSISQATHMSPNIDKTHSPNHEKNISNIDEEDGPDTLTSNQLTSLLASLLQAAQNANHQNETDRVIQEVDESNQPITDTMQLPTSDANDLLRELLSESGVMQNNNDEDFTEEQVQEFALALIAHLGGSATGSELQNNTEGFSCNNPPSAALRKEQMLAQVIAERRQDPDKQHLADVWEDLLRQDPREVEEERMPKKFSKSLGLRAKISAWRARRKEV